MTYFWIVISLLAMWQLWTIGRCIVQLNNNHVLMGKALLKHMEAIRQHLRDSQGNLKDISDDLGGIRQEQKKI